MTISNFTTLIFTQQNTALLIYKDLHIVLTIYLSP